MPQMSPMDWISLFFYFLLIYMIVIINTHYIFKMKLSPNNPLPLKKMLLKWY